MLFGYFSNCDILLKFQIKDGFLFKCTFLQKCSTNEFFNLETYSLLHHVIIMNIQHCIKI